jgi:uroporphyrinogen decarboxylase
MMAPPCHSVGYFGVNHQGFDAPEGHNVPVGTRWTDIWGTGWHKEHAGVMGFPEVAPLAEPSALSRYSWPDPNDERICAAVYRQAAADHDSDTFLAGRHRDTLWEKAYMLVGMERMMEYFYTEPEFARSVLHGIMDFQLSVARHYLSIGIEMAQLGDDMGTQAGPLLGPRIVEEFLVPEYRRIFELYRSTGVLINFHSCGAIEWMIDTFLDLGVDVLNPIQATANDLDVVRRKTHGKVALLGAVESHVVASGPPEAITAQVRRRMWQLGRDGGYFCGPDQHMPWPDDHYRALVEAVEEYGVYPLQPAE